MERTKNSVKNIIMSIAVQLSTLLVSFVSRKVFLQVLGSELLGVHGLFGNILSILSLTELGVSAAITYNLYKPLSEDNQRQVAQLINYYKRLYTGIGCTVFIIGILVLPFLKYLINVENPIANIGFYYFIFLMNSVLSYFFVYKTAVMIADQKNYKLSVITIAVNTCKMLLQIWVLIDYQSYMMYLAIQLIIGVLGNYISSRYVEAKYPYIKEKVKADKEQRKVIFSHVKDMFSYQLGAVILNNTDNILISVLVNTKTVGLYSNYSMIIQAISSTTSMFFTGINASIGNFLVKAKADSQFHMFRLLTFVSFWIYTFASVSILNCLEPVIDIFFGKKYIIGNTLLYICVFNFYITGILYPIWSFRNTIGLFRQTKNIMFYTSGINLVLSFLLGSVWGLNGILLATGISRVLTTVWFEPFILYEKYFQRSRRELFTYYLRQIMYFMEMVGIAILTVRIGQYVMVDSKVMELFIRVLLSVIVPNLVIIVLHARSSEFKKLLFYAKGLFERKIRG